MRGHDPLFELLPLGVQFLEVELLTDALERLGELGDEQALEGLLVRSTPRTDGPRDVKHVVSGVVDPDEERHLDVRANVVAADEAFLRGTGQLDRLDRDVHLFSAIDNGDDEATGEEHFDLTHLVDDECGALVDLAIQLGVQSHHTDQEEDQSSDPDPDVHCDLKWFH